MTTTINAVAGTGLVSTSDGSGVCKVQSNGVTTNALAWVNFQGGATPSVNQSYNVSSVTNTATGVYQLNFTNTLSDTKYCVVGQTMPDTTAQANGIYFAGVIGTSAVPVLKTTSAVKVTTVNYTPGGITSSGESAFVIFGN